MQKHISCRQKIVVMVLFRSFQDIRYKIVLIHKNGNDFIYVGDTHDVDFTRLFFCFQRGLKPLNLPSATGLTRKLCNTCRIAHPASRILADITFHLSESGIQKLRKRNIR